MDLWYWVAALAVGCVGVWRAARRRDRARRLMLLCHRADLEFAPVDPFPDTLWLPFRWLVGGRWTRAEHVVWNRADPDVRAFDLIVEEARTNEDAPPVIRRYACATATVPFGCPRLELAPRDVFTDASTAFGGGDIELELEGFNRRYRIVSEDRRFAVAFCDQRMMRTLMGLPRGVTVAVNEDRVLLRAGELSPAATLLLFEAARAVARAAPPAVGDLYPPRPSVGPYEERWLQGHWSPEPIGDDAPAWPAPEGGRA